MIKSLLHIRNESLLSHVSDLPQCFYHEPSETHICFWLGMGMTQAQAQMIVAEWYRLSWITDAMKHAAFHDFCRAYLHNAFGDVNWREALNAGALNHYSRLRHKIIIRAEKYDPNNHVFNRHTVQQALRWFNREDDQTLTT